MRLPPPDPLSSSSSVLISHPSIHCLFIGRRGWLPKPRFASHGRWQLVGRRLKSSAPRAARALGAVSNTEPRNANATGLLTFTRCSLS
jgi:hypothetical protein